MVNERYIFLKLLAIVKSVIMDLDEEGLELTEEFDMTENEAETSSGGSEEAAGKEEAGELAEVFSKR